jgi:hypothetical protein
MNLGKNLRVKIMEKLPEEENSIISKNLRADPRPLPPPPSGLPPS